MVEEWLSFPKPPELLKNIQTPLKIILAAKSKELVRDWRRGFAKLRMKKKLVIIPKASHNFDEEGTEDKLFAETLSWLE